MIQDEMIFEIIKITLALVAALFTYFQFFREGKHKQRIQFDIDCKKLGVVSNEQIIEIACIAENKGNVEQRFDDIRVVIRGIEKDSSLLELEGNAPRLAFPLKLASASLVQKKWEYYFVRPHVEQRFPLVVRIPQNVMHILVRSTFKYKNTSDIHSAERAFSLETAHLE
jgi:hypothetical protein